MPDAAFHFARPEWLFALFGLLPVLGWLIFSVTRPSKGPIHLYADEHLLPHLTGVRELEVNERWGRFIRWALLWILAVIAMAGPRWDYTDVEAFTPGSDLIILMDISRSMEVADVQPSRLGRARQEIQDLIQLNREVRIGLIAFASVSHIVSPITEDGQSILNALPALSTDLTRLQGSRLHTALDKAEQLLKGQPSEGGRSILLISDGDFDEPDLAKRVKTLAADGIRLHVLGIGTSGGGPVPAPTGLSDLMRDRAGKIIESRLNEPLLKQLASTGNGHYLQANFRDDDSRTLLTLAASDAAEAVATDEKTRIWNERFYWMLIPLVLLLLPTFRRQQTEGGL
ncbi:vWA domain-containing protein [endosymbiont of Lamellibrachia barhami]|uniref:vWA domain-containing protein n=1 Tax=endosymbiont of Lamellibrachia barhami TaxID=205975 RepID=UPI0015A8768C|nr:VWA domain-containing protein [endosymbiont of Lamellibrachia barhami]